MSDVELNCGKKGEERRIRDITNSPHGLQWVQIANSMEHRWEGE